MTLPMDSPAAVAPTGSLGSRRSKALALGGLAPARAADAVLEQAAKSGEVLMVGATDSPPPGQDRAEGGT